MAKRAQKSPGGGTASTGVNATNPVAPQVGPVVKAASKPSAKPAAKAIPKITAKAASKPASEPKPKPSPKAAKPAPQVDAETSDHSDYLGAANQGQANFQANSSGGGMRMGKSENYLDFLARVFQNMGTNSWDAQQLDSVTQGMTLVLGSGPAFAALESMMANTTAQSAVLMNAVQTQRQLDQVGLCCTSACVQQLLNMNNNQDRD